MKKCTGYIATIKDVGNPYANLYQTIPTNEVIKDAMFDYMRTKNGNIIAVVDKKKSLSCST
jgi:ABC-type branched-subunit amino acid transport system substrate-binding protein